MAMTGFDFDDRTMKVIESLQESFGVKTNAAVIRRALALARVVAQNADDDHSVVIVGKDDEPVKIRLAG
jgi:hypothetical protein